MPALGFDETVESLVALAHSDSALTPAPIDDIIDPYLSDASGNPLAHRLELAEAFLDKGGTSERSDFIHLRILGRIIP